MNLMLKYLKKYRIRAILGPFFKFLEAMFELIVPLVMAKIIDVGIKNSDINYILKMGGVLVILGVSGLAFSLICQFFASSASQHCGTDLRNDFFRFVNSLSSEKINEIGTQTLRTRMTTDINQIQSGIAMIIRLGVRAPFLIIGSTVMAFIINPSLATIFCVIVPVVGLVIYLIMKHTTPMYKKIQSRLDKTGNVVKENLSGVRVIRAFAQEDAEKRRFDLAQDEYTSACIRTSRISVLLNPLVQVIINIGIVVLLYSGAFSVDNSLISQGQLTALLNYMTQIMLALFAFANLITIFTKALASSSRVNDIMVMTNNVYEGEKNIENYQIEFQDVSFAYSDGKNALNNLSFVLKEGQSLGVIGGTGSGKSTLGKLLTRLVDAKQGNILIGGEKIEEYSKKSLQKNIGYVPQRARLFSGTIRFNVSMGEEYSDEEIHQALKIAQIDEYILGNEKSLDYESEENGSNFSGGQKQRLSIARALVKNPRIIILDDSSSALDFATEKTLRMEIEKLKSTKIIISQRYQSIKNSDMILVLDNGFVAGLGTHQDLLDKCSVYKEIVKSQNRGDE